MNDLLSDSFVNSRDQGNRNADIEMGMERQAGDLGLEDFFKNVWEIEKQYEKLNALLRKLQEAHEESKAVTKAAAMKAIKKRMEKDVKEVGKIAHSIKSKIEELDKENLSNRQKPGCGKGSGVDRSRTATTVALKKKFKDKMSDFQDSFMNSRDQAGDLSLEDFFNKVREIEKQYEKLNALLRKLQEAHEESKAVTKAAAMKAIKKRMEKDVKEVGKTACLIKSKIEELDKENLSSRQKPGCGKGSGVDRSRTATTLALKKKFKDKMSDFQTLRENIHQEYRQVVERRVFTVTGNRADEETIDTLIESGDSEQIFQNAIREQGRGQIKDTLAEIQERRDAVRDLEKKLLDLQQIFIDMAVLVDAQGDMLDNIELQVSSAVDHVEFGNIALQKAKSLRRKSRKWMCIAILILLSIVAIILVGVL